MNAGWWFLAEDNGKYNQVILTSLIRRRAFVLKQKLSQHDEHSLKTLTLSEPYDKVGSLGVCKNLLDRQKTDHKL